MKSHLADVNIPSLDASWTNHLFYLWPNCTLLVTHKGFFQEWRIIGILLEYEAMKLWPYTEEGNRRPQNQGKGWETTKSKNKPIKEFFWGCLSWPTISTIIGCEAMHTSKILLLVARPISGLITRGMIRRASFGKNYFWTISELIILNHFWVDHTGGDKKDQLWQELVIDGKKVAGGSIRKNFLEDLDLWPVVSGVANQLSFLFLFSHLFTILSFTDKCCLMPTSSPGQLLSPEKKKKRRLPWIVGPDNILHMIFPIN